MVILCLRNINFVSFTLYLVHEAMCIFYTAHQCYQVSFLACPHPIDHKPHQQAFFCQQNGLVHFFNYLNGIIAFNFFWYTVFHILFFNVQPEMKSGH